MRILLVEDDRHIIAAITAVFHKQAYTVDVATEGLAGYELAASFSYNLIVLDVMLPNLDGISFCQRLRSQGNKVPVLILTACNSSFDKKIGLDAGADDYVVKPCDLQELLARVRALLRRSGIDSASVLSWGKLQIDSTLCKVSYGQQPLNLTPKEYAILELFLRHKGRIFSRSAIINQIWSSDEPPGEETVKAHIKGLRHKLKTVAAADLIETLYGQGYRLNAAYLAEDTITLPETDQSLQGVAGKRNDLEQRFKSSPLNFIPTISNAQSLQKSEAQMTKIWSKTRAIAFDRLSVLEQAAQTLHQGFLEEELRQQANQAAHKLLGSLGTFGLQEGSHLAHQLEAAFESQKTTEPTKIRHIETLVTELRQVIERGCQLQSDLKSLTHLSQTIPAHCSKTVSQLSQQSPFTEVKVIAVDDDRVILMLLKTLLEPWGIELTALQNSLQFWETLETVQPDLLILDVDLPEISGLELCRAVRDLPKWCLLPVLFLSGHTQPSTIHQMFEVGANDYVSKPIVASELINRILNRLEYTHLLRSMAETDLLTGVLNRQRSTQALEQFLRLAESSQQPVCLAVVDVDALQQINRCQGHDTGDRVLRQVGQVLKQKLRQEDVVARWSSSEFVVGMYGTHRRDGVKWLANILETLHSMQFTALSETIPVRFSAGIAQYPQDGTDIQTLYRAAEAASCQAKQAGGDRILSVDWQSLNPS